MQQMYGWSWYGTRDLQVVPLMKGSPVYRDGMLSTLYYRTREEGNIETTFCGEDKTHDQFVTMFENLKTLQVLCEIKDGGTLVPAGYSWGCNPRGVDGARIAQPGMCFFGEAGKRSVARDLARLAVAYAFIDLRINVLHGVQVVSNYAARNFSLRLGFKQTAIIPKYHVIDGRLEDARVMTLVDEDFVPGFIAWKEKQEKVV